MNRTELKYKTVVFPKKDFWIGFMEMEMRQRTFADKIKGCVDIDHTMIESFFKKLLQKEFGLNVRISRAWIHFIAPRGDHVSGHEHSTDIGVYYLQIPKNSGVIRFDDLNSEIVPQENMFLIVPALTKHSMTENKSDGIRLAIGFPFEVLK